jgi:hypothetical protein
MANILASSVPVGLPPAVLKDISFETKKIQFSLNTYGIINEPFTFAETTLTKISGTSELDDPNVINNDEYSGNFYSTGETNGWVNIRGYEIIVFYNFTSLVLGDVFEITWKLSNWVEGDGRPIIYGSPSPPLRFTVANITLPTPELMFASLATLEFIIRKEYSFVTSARATITTGTSIVNGPTEINSIDNPYSSGNNHIRVGQSNGLPSDIFVNYGFKALFQGDTIVVTCAVSSSPLDGTIVYGPPSSFTYTVLSPGISGGKQLVASDIQNTSISVSMLNNNNTGFGSAEINITERFINGEPETGPGSEVNSTTKDPSGNYIHTFTGLSENNLYLVTSSLRYFTIEERATYSSGRLLLYTSPGSNIPPPTGIPPVPKVSHRLNLTIIIFPGAPLSIQGPISGVVCHICPENTPGETGSTIESNEVLITDSSGNYRLILNNSPFLWYTNCSLYYQYFNLLDSSIVNRVEGENWKRSNCGMIPAPIFLTGNRGNEPPPVNIVSYTDTTLTISAEPDVFAEYVSLVASATISITGTSTTTETVTTKDVSGNYTTTFTGLTNPPYTIDYYLNFTDGARGFDSTPVSYTLPPSAPSRPICYELDYLRFMEFICNSSSALNGPFTGLRLKLTKDGVDTIKTRSGDDLFNSSGNTSVTITDVSINIGDQLQISWALSNTPLGTTPEYGLYSAPLNITVTTVPFGNPFMSLINNTETSITVSLSQRAIYGTYSGASFFIAPGSVADSASIRNIYTNTPQLSTPDASGNYVTTFTGLTENSLYTIFGAFYNVNPTIIRRYDIGSFYTAPGANISGTPPAPTILNMYLSLVTGINISISVPTISEADSADLLVSSVDSSGTIITNFSNGIVSSNVITMDLDLGLELGTQYILLSYRYTNSAIQTADRDSFGPISDAIRVNIISGTPSNEIVTYTTTSLTFSASTVGITGTTTSAIFRLTTGESYSDQTITTKDASGNYVTTFTGLSPATQYNVLHYFTFNNGIGLFSAGQNVNTAPSVPPAPTLVTATTNTLTVSVTTTETVTGVNFSLRPASGGTAITRAGVSSGSNEYTYTFTGLSVFTFYNITCVALSGTSQGATSPVLNTRTLAGPPSTPSAPSLNMNLAAPQSQGSISVMGLVSGIDNPPFTSAQFIIAPANTAVTPIPAVTAKAGILSQDQTYYYCTFTGLEPGSQYLVSWNITNISATSATSPTASIQTAPSPSANLTWPNINVSTDAYGLFVRWGNARTTPTEFISYTITVSDALTGGGIYTASSGTTFATQPFYIAQSDINFIYGAMRLNQRILAATAPVAPSNTYYVTVSVSGTVTGTPITSNPFTTIYRSPYSCFKTGTKILCLTEGLKEEYIPIEEVRKGTIVKTLKQSYVRVNVIGKSIIDNPDNDDRGPNRLFKLTKENYPELTEDLIMTGCHSILVDKLSAEQERIQMRLMGTLYLTTDKYRLLTFVDEKAEPYISPGEHEIWHLALDNDNYVCNYGIYANGLLVETASIKNMKELSKMTLVD